MGAPYNIAGLPERCSAFEAPVAWHTAWGVPEVSKWASPLPLANPVSLDRQLLILCLSFHIWKMGIRFPASGHCEMWVTRLPVKQLAACAMHEHLVKEVTGRFLVIVMTIFFFFT